MPVGGSYDVLLLSAGLGSSNRRIEHLSEGGHFDVA
jgi:hypothetical protein